MSKFKNRHFRCDVNKTKRDLIFQRLPCVSSRKTARKKTSDSDLQTMLPTVELTISGSIASFHPNKEKVFAQKRRK